MHYIPVIKHGKRLLSNCPCLATRSFSMDPSARASYVLKFRQVRQLVLSCCTHKYYEYSSDRSRAVVVVWRYGHWHSSIIFWGWSGSMCDEDVDDYTRCVIWRGVGFSCCQRGLLLLLCVGEARAAIWIDPVYKYRWIAPWRRHGLIN
jgi:hypothetical protein